MTQEELDRQLSEIPDEVLIEKSTAILNDWCAGGNKFTMSVPPTKNCPDLIVAELIERFKRYSENNWIEISELSKYNPEDNILIWQDNLSENKYSRFQRAILIGNTITVYPLSHRTKFKLNADGFYEGYDLEGDLCRVTHFQLIKNP